MLKATAILLVVWCHCVQYIGEQTFENTIFSIVYSFHMPLFALISGLLFYRKHDDDFYVTIKGSIYRLLIPALFTGGVMQIASGEYGLMGLWRFPFRNWFLTALFACIVLFMITRKLANGNIWLQFMFMFFLSFFLPGSSLAGFIVPFWGIGCILAKLNFNKYEFKWWHIVSFGIMIALAYNVLWHRNYYIYMSPTPSIRELFQSNWGAYWVRLQFGSTISIWLLMVGKKTEHIFHKYSFIFTQLSKNSLGIYVIQGVVIFVPSYIRFRNTQYTEWFLDFAMLFITCIIICVIHFIIKGIRKSKILKILILGE